jgi:hypothetical protein
LKELNAIRQSQLVNEDPVTYVICFNRLVDIFMRLLQHRKISPFGEHRIVDYFKRIEFQYRGSPHAHLLIWLENDPLEEISEDMTNTVSLIDKLCSVSSCNVQNYGNQIHKHMFTCCKKTDDKCRFNIPYWPMDTICILIPMSLDDSCCAGYKKKASKMMTG